MRLYDQSSSTPIKLDCKKWMRPTNFLPSQREATLTGPPNTHNEEHSDSACNAKSGSETSASTAIEISKVYKQHTIYDDFRFDIDEDQELSLKSSSTLSTHSTLRHMALDPYGRCKKELPKPISLCKNEASCVLRNSILAMRAQENLSTDSGENSTPYFSTNDEENSSFDDDFLAPKLALTQSSEEGDSVWIEFTEFNSNNPFRPTHDTHKSNKQRSTRKKTSMDNQPLGIRSSSKPDSNMSRRTNFGTIKRMLPSKHIIDKGSGNYSKYYKMLIDGVSVNEVSNTMENDIVDPSIISLVLAASKSSKNLKNL